MPWMFRMTLLLALAASLFQLYAGRKTVRAIATLTGWRRRALHLTAGAVELWLLAYPLLILVSYSFDLQGVFRSFQRSSEVQDALITYPFWIGVVLAVQVSMFFLVLDIGKLLCFPVYRKRKAAWQRIESYIVIALVCGTGIYVLGRVYSDLHTVRVHRTELRISGLPAELDGFRIAHIADVQEDNRTGKDRLEEYFDLVRRQNPDLILFAGDLVTSGTDYIEGAAQTMSGLKAAHGVYACLGDHDFFSNRNMVARDLTANGVTLLDNESIEVQVGSSSISITGITNVYPSRPPPALLDSIEARRAKSTVNILLTHQPSNWLVKYAESKGYDLFLGGHTHGGQIVFPLPGFLLTGSSFETHYVSGFYRAGAMLVAINNGLGLTLAPIRYNATPEVTVIVLRRA
jgi:predicted MPP superfamily phosphohydrolase